MTLADVLRLHALGLNVIPLKARSKEPAAPWKKYQTAHSTADDLATWFGNGIEHNAAIVCGQSSGVVCVDADTPEQDAWCEAHLPRTPMMTRTARGTHRFYRLPTGQGAGVAVPAQLRVGHHLKIDVRRDGQFVVAPLSVHPSGHVYREVEAWPSSLDSVPEFPVGELGVSAPKRSEPLPAVISEGARNSSLFREAARLRQQGLETPEILATLTAINQARCRPPLATAEVEQIAASVSRYEPAADRFPLTEAGDAEALAHHFQDAVRYDHRRGRWLVADELSGIWLPDPVERLTLLAIEVMRVRQRQATAIEDTTKRKEAWNWAIKGEGRGRLTNALALARSVPPIADVGDHWDENPFLLGVPGGVVDLRTGVQRKARPEDRVTMRTRIDYDPAARSTLWERTLLAISNDDPDWVQYLLRLGGYTTTGDTSQDKWFIKQGTHGREGKGTIDDPWSHALGDYALELPSAVFDLHPRGNPDFDLSYLPGKRFVLSGETGDTIHLNHDRIKKLTGGGEFRAANKFEKSFQFVPTCKLWLACNNFPTVTDDSLAFWARVIVIPFRRSFAANADTTLRPTLTYDPAHQRAVLASLVRGAVEYCREGLGEMPASVREATRAFRDVSWPLMPMVREDCDEGLGAYVSVGDFNIAYHRFCDHQGIPKERRLGWKRLIKLMATRYATEDIDAYVGGRHVREKRYLGLRLREPVPKPVVAGGCNEDHDHRTEAEDAPF